MRRFLAIPILLFLSALPARAEEAPRFTVAVDLGASDLSGADHDVGVRTNSNLNFVGGDVVGLDPGSSFTPRILFVYHGSVSNHLLISYRRYDDDEEKAFTDSTGFYPTLTAPGLGIPFANSIHSRLDQTLDTVDVGWARELAATKDSEWLWGAGIRWMRYRSEWVTDYDRGVDVVEIDNDSDGVGLTFGIRGEYRFSHRVSLRGTVGAGLLKGTTDAKFHEKTAVAIGEISRQDADRIFQTVDLGAHLAFSVTRGFEISVGYQFSRAGDMATSDRIADDVQQGDILSIKEPVALDGFVLGFGASW